jgi:hypothetical protein
MFRVLTQGMSFESPSSKLSLRKQEKKVVVDAQWRNKWGLWML